MQSIAKKQTNKQKRHYEAALNYRSLLLKLLTKKKKNKRNQTLFSSYIQEVTSSEKMNESIKNSNTRAYKKSRFQTNTA